MILTSDTHEYMSTKPRPFDKCFMRIHVFPWIKKKYNYKILKEWLIKTSCNNNKLY